MMMDVLNQNNYLEKINAYTLDGEHYTTFTCVKT